MAPYRSYVHPEMQRTFHSFKISQIDTTISYRLLASRTFAFLVGPDKEPIDIHIRLLQSLSEPLDKLMNNGQMRESIERVAVLEDVDVETFGLFAEFCYTRNYRAPPKPKRIEAAKDASDAPRVGNAGYR